MRLPVAFEFLILVIIACLFISICATVWIALMEAIWNKLVTPVFACCRRVITTHIELYLRPALYQRRGPYNWLDLICHPYFHPSLELSRLERYFLFCNKSFGVLLVRYFCTPVCRCELTIPCISFRSPAMLWPKHSGLSLWVSQKR